jgi:hypothetical protein
MFSEDSVKELNKYTKRLVRRQPLWLRQLFDNESVVFTLEESGELSMHVDSSLEDATKEHIQKLVSKYMEKHPTPCLAMQELH